jgi:hypothetical protein
MEIFLGFVSYFYDYLIKGIFISVLILILAQQLLNDKKGTLYAAKIIKWIVIIYAIAYLITIPLDLIVATDSYTTYAILNRAFGPYWFPYWFSLIVTCVFPLSLFWRKLGANLYVLLVVAILMNKSLMYELFVTDMKSSVSSWQMNFPSDFEILSVFSGFFVGIIVLILGEMLQYWKGGCQKNK